MPRWLTEIPRRPFRALGSFALLALCPKCVVCLLAYADLGAVLGLRSTEICGATAGSLDLWVSSFAGFGVALAIAGWFASLRRRRSSSSSQRGHS